MKKIRRFLSAALALLTAITTTLTIAGCDKSVATDEPEHVFSRRDYDYDDDNHWVYCQDCDERFEEGEHKDNGEGQCAVCEYIFATEDVVYTLSADETYATVTGYEGDEPRVAIAQFYEGVPVRYIAERAFENCLEISRVILPKNIVGIGACAFYNCSNFSGIFIHDNVKEIGKNAFYGCELLVIFCEAEAPPSGWVENWKGSGPHTLWGREDQRMPEVSAAATLVAGGMLNVGDPQWKQLKENFDLEGATAPEGFSTLIRYDSKQKPMEGETAALEKFWEKEVLWYYNFDKTDLTEYKEVWFAARLENAFWAFVNGPESVSSPWVYFHLEQMGFDEYGHILWRIDVSIGGQLYGSFENQTGKHIEDDRPKNSISRILWDEGFHSAELDGNAVLIYPSDENPKRIYCTEVVGLKKGY
ncbi:MAG: leucine-rich repeat domain-containing protein [Clostridia bacterium]|nr:leucine-rich repeat domain-containing protein [Clostridia bacterium]